MPRAFTQDGLLLKQVSRVFRQRSRVLYSAWLHTGFLTEGQVTLSRPDLDKVSPPVAAAGHVPVPAILGSASNADAMCLMPRSPECCPNLQRWS